VSYIGWNAYGRTWHLAEFGWNMIWPKPLRLLAVIDPCLPVVRSVMSTRTPAGVSWMCTRIVSPGFIIRSTDGSGLSAFATPSSSRSRDVASGFAGACDLPLRVT